MSKYQTEDAAPLAVIEAVLCLLLFAIPGFVFKELIFGVKNIPNIFALTAATLLVVTFMIIVFYLGGLRLRHRIVPLFASLYLAQCAFFVCFYIIFQSQESFRLPQQTLFQISVSFAVLVYLAQSAAAGELCWRRNYLNFPMFLILAFGIVSFAFTADFWTSLKDYVELLCIVLLFWLLVIQFDARRHLKLVAALAILIGAFMSIIGVMQLFNFNELYGIGSNFDPFSTLGNKNYVAEILAMLLPFTLAVSLAAPRLWQKALLWLAAESMLIVVIVAETRGSWLGLLVGLGVLLLFGADRFDAAHARRVALMVVALAVNALLIMILSQNRILFDQGPIPYKDRLDSMIRVINSIIHSSTLLFIVAAIGCVAMMAASYFMLRTGRARKLSYAITVVAALGIVSYAMVTRHADQSKAAQQAAHVAEQATAFGPRALDDSIASRRFIYGGTFEMIRHNPFGTGIGAYKIHYLEMLKKYLDDQKIEEIPGFFKDVNAKEAHNEYLHTLAEQGPIGLLLLLFFIVRLIQYFYRVYYSSGDRVTGLFALGAFSGLAAIGSSAMLGFPFRIVPTAAASCLLLAVLVFCDDRNAIAAASKNPAAPPVLLDPRRWSISRLDVTARTLCVAIGLLFCVPTSIYSYLWQSANIDMKAGEAYVRMGDNLAQQGNKEAAEAQYKEALRTYKRSLANDPSNGEIHFKIGMYYQAMADHEQALSKEREVLLDNAIDALNRSLKYYDLPQARLNLGASYFHKGEFYFEQARRPENAAKSKELFDKGYAIFAKAENQFEETISLYPNYSLPWFNLALIQYEYARRADEKRESNMIQSYQIEQKINTDTTLSKTDKTNLSKEVTKLRTQANDSYQVAVGYYKKAEKLFRKTLAIEPSLVVANFKLGICLERLNLQGDAQIQYEKTIKFPASKPGDGPTLGDAHYNLGILYATQSMYIADSARVEGVSVDRQQELFKLSNEFKDKAQLMFEKTLDYNWQHIKAHNNLANILYKQGQNELAMQHYEAALDLNPNYPEAKLNLTLVKLNLAHEAMQQGKADAAAGIFNSALMYAQEMLNASPPPTGSQRLKLMRIAGVCLQNTNRLDDAASVLTQLAQMFRGRPEQMEPDYNLALINLAEVAMQKGSFSSAAGTLNEVIKNPVIPINQLRALSKLGQFQLQAGDKQGAIATLARAAALKELFYDEPEFSDALIRYTDALHLAGQSAKALNVLIDFLKLPISNVSVRSVITVKIGQFYAVTGDSDNAKSAFRKVVDSNWPHAAQAKQYLQMLDQVPSPASAPPQQPEGTAVPPQSGYEISHPESRAIEVRPPVETPRRPPEPPALPQDSGADEN